MGKKTTKDLRALLSYNFMPTIRVPTRISPTSATLIDNIFINDIKYMYNSVVVYSDVSDHLPIALHMKICAPKVKLNNLVRRRHFDDDAIEKFNRHLASIDWNALLTGNLSATEEYDKFCDVYIDVFNIYFPECTIKLSHRMTPRRPWMTKGLIKSCNKKSKLYRKVCKSQNAALHKKYIAYRNKLKSLLRTAEKNYYSVKFNAISGNIRATWKLLGSMLNNNQLTDVTHCFTSEGIDITDKIEIVEKFNEYFVNLGSRLASVIPTSHYFFY